MSPASQCAHVHREGGLTSRDGPTGEPCVQRLHVAFSSRRRFAGCPPPPRCLYCPRLGVHIGTPTQAAATFTLLKPASTPTPAHKSKCGEPGPASWAHVVAVCSRQFITIVFKFVGADLLVVAKHSRNLEGSGIPLKKGVEGPPEKNCRNCKNCILY